MAADLLSQKTSTLPELGGERAGSVLFYISVALFFLALAIFGGLAILNPAQKNARTNAIADVSNKEDSIKGDLDQIFSIDQRLKNLRTLLSNHVFASNILRLIENDTHPQVRFSSFNLDIASRKIDMAGEAASFRVLAQQIDAFQNDPMIERVDFGGLSITSNNLAGFRITIIVKPALWQQQQPSASQTSVPPRSSPPSSQLQP